MLSRTDVVTYHAVLITTLPLQIPGTKETRMVDLMMENKNLIEKLRRCILLRKLLLYTEIKWVNRKRALVGWVLGHV